MNAQTTPWVRVGHITDIPRRGARVVRTGFGSIALFRTAEDQVFALDNRCPHRDGPLSEGIVHDGAVTCPLHNWVIDLESGQVRGPDEGCVKTYAVSVEDGEIRLSLAGLAPAAA